VASFAGILRPGDDLGFPEVPAVYERFTERARKVMQLVSQEARRFNHEYIGTEHILLGLVREAASAQVCLGVAANVLGHFGIDLRKVRLEVEKIVLPGPEGALTGRMPQTPRAKKVIEYAIEEARRLNHPTVGTGCLLLGLLREEEGVAAQVLLNLGLRLDNAGEAVARLLVGREGRRLMAGPPDWAGLNERPEELRPALEELDAQVEALNRQKEQVVAAMDFEQAASLRDQADRLKKQKQALRLDWLRRHRPDPDWLTREGGQAARVARAIYEERRWGDLPVLADALEDAGCTDREILDHCRRPGEHGPGCWVLDLLLGEA
jgi:ATP-dependent Clp protease ATP-binding subunit ClpA